MAELTGLPATDRNLATVKTWLAAGYDPEQDIYPAVAEALPTATDEIGYFAYFTKAIKRHHAHRMTPPIPNNVSYLPHAAGGRQAKREDPAIARLRARMAEEQAEADQRGAL